MIFTETKTDAFFPNFQFIIDDYSPPFRCNRNNIEGGVFRGGSRTTFTSKMERSILDVAAVLDPPLVFIFIRDDIPCRALSEHKFAVDIEGIFIEINLRKTKWLILGTYRPLNQSTA